MPRGVDIGLIGEMTVAYHLSKLPDVYHVMHDIWLACPPYSKSLELDITQVDHMVVGPFGVAVIETKWWGAEAIWFDERESTCRIRRRDGVITRRNPMAQNEWHAAMVKRILRRAGMPAVPVYNIIVLRSKTRFLGLRTHKTTKVVVANRLSGTLTNLPKVDGIDTDACLRALTLYQTDDPYFKRQHKLRMMRFRFRRLAKG